MDRLPVDVEISEEMAVLAAGQYDIARRGRNGDHLVPLGRRRDRRDFGGLPARRPKGSDHQSKPDDKGEKLVLGKRIAAGGGIEDGLRVLDLLAKHPSTAKFISFKLAQRFVADEPPTSLVDRAAEVFTKTDGDIRQVVRLILTSPEFYSPKAYRNKIKSPLELAASAIRATGAATDGASPLIQTVARMGEPLYQCQPPTGYSEDSSRWLSNATLLERMNFALALIGNRINGTRVEVGRFVAAETARDQKRLLDGLLAAFVHSEVSKETRDNLAKVLNDQRAKATPAKFDNRQTNELIGSLAALVLGSREFQVK